MSNNNSFWSPKRNTHIQARWNELSIGAASQGLEFTIHESGASGTSNGVGSRGRAPAGDQGAVPPEALGF